MEFIEVVQARCGQERIAFCSQCVLATSIEFSPRPFHTSAMTMVHSCYVIEHSITLLTRSFGSLHVCCTFAAGSHRVYASKFSINSGSNSSHHHLCFNNDLNMNQELLLQLDLLHGHQARLDARAALVLVRRRRRRRQPRSRWVHSFTYEPRQANLCLRAFRHDKF